MRVSFRKREWSINLGDNRIYFTVLFFIIIKIWLTINQDNNFIYGV